MCATSSPPLVSRISRAHFSKDKGELLNQKTESELFQVIMSSGWLSALPTNVLAKTYGVFPLTKTGE
jgi:hypothetical protein